MSGIRIIVAVAMMVFISCNEVKKKPEEKKTVGTTTVVTAPKPEIHYHLDSIENKAQLDSLLHSLDTMQSLIVLSLNRLSPGRIHVGSKLILPDSILIDRMAYSPFPDKISSLDSFPKLILISERVQAFAAYENGTLVHWGPTSTGRKTKPTPSGLHYTNYKARLKISTIDGDWKMPWYFNIENNSGIGMHQFVMPGYPASHSCVRLLETDAIFIFNWAEQWQLTNKDQTIAKNGTPVIIFGKYAFGETPPWKKLQEDPKASQITDEEITNINSYLPQIKK